MATPMSPISISSDGSDLVHGQLPIYMTRPQLEGFCIHLHTLLNAREGEIAYLDDIIAHQNHEMAELAHQFNYVNNELVNSKRTLDAWKICNAAGRMHLQNAHRRLNEKDQEIEALRAEVGNLSVVMGRLAQMARPHVEASMLPSPPEDAISPLILPSPMVTPTATRDEPPRITRKRCRSFSYANPIESPSTAKKNGRPTHISKRARHMVESREVDHVTKHSQVRPRRMVGMAERMRQDRARRAMAASDADVPFLSLDGVAEFDLGVSSTETRAETEVEDVEDVEDASRSMAECDLGDPESRRQ
jgi:hypothetical protein